MRLNKKMQYGFLFALYLSRAGRGKVADAAANMNISKHFLEQVARKLRLSGVIKSVRGPGGGYELVGDPTAFEVLNALSPVALLKSVEFTRYKTGASEERAFAQYAFNLAQALHPVMRRKIRNIGAELVANELATLNRVEVTVQAN